MRLREQIAFHRAQHRPGPLRGCVPCLDMMGALPPAGPLACTHPEGDPCGSKIHPANNPRPGDQLPNGMNAVYQEAFPQCAATLKLNPRSKDGH